MITLICCANRTLGTGRCLGTASLGTCRRYTGIERDEPRRQCWTRMGEAGRKVVNPARPTAGDHTANL